MLDCELEVSNNDNVVNCSMESFKRLCQPLLILQKKRVYRLKQYRGS